MSGRGYRAAGFMDGFMNGFDFVDGLRRADEERDYRRRVDGERERMLDLLGAGTGTSKHGQGSPKAAPASGLPGELGKQLRVMEGMSPYIRNDRLLGHLRGAYGLLGGGGATQTEADEPEPFP